MAGVAVERDEHQRRCRALVALGLAAVFDKEVTTGRVRREHHDQRGDHVVGLLRVLVTGEELAGLVHQHRMQFRSQTGRVGEPEVGTDGVEHRVEGLVPAAFVDPDPRLRDLPRCHEPVGRAPCRCRGRTSPGERRVGALWPVRHSPGARSIPPHERRCPGRRSVPSAESRTTLGAQVRQQLGELVPMRSTHASTAAHPGRICC